jgi:hypothetical protein
VGRPCRFCADRNLGLYAIRLMPQQRPLEFTATPAPSATPKFAEERESSGPLVANRKQQHYRLNSNIAYKSVISVMVIVLSLGLFGIIVVVAYWFAREEQKTITWRLSGNERRGRKTTLRR